MNPAPGDWSDRRVLNHKYVGIGQFVAGAPHHKERGDTSRASPLADPVSRVGLAVDRDCFVLGPLERIGLDLLEQDLNALH